MRARSRSHARPRCTSKANASSMPSNATPAARTLARLSLRNGISIVRTRSNDLPGMPADELNKDVELVRHVALPQTASLRRLDESSRCNAAKPTALVLRQSLVEAELTRDCGFISFYLLLVPPRRLCDTSHDSISHASPGRSFHSVYRR